MYNNNTIRIQGKISNITYKTIIYIIICYGLLLLSIIHIAIPLTLNNITGNIECLKLFSKKCYYCGFINQDHGIGIDRANNSKGYIKSNCVPCCTLCNIMKKDNDLMTFIKICQHIATVNNKFDGNIDYNLFDSASNPSFISYIVSTSSPSQSKAMKAYSAE